MGYEEREASGMPYDETDSYTWAEAFVKKHGGDVKIVAEWFYQHRLDVDESHWHDGCDC